MTRDQSEQIEKLLLNWYRWQIRQSHADMLAHYYRPEDRTCREYETPMTEEERDEEAQEWADDQQSTQVQQCIDALPPEQRAAISTSMRNKLCERPVWSTSRAGDGHATYQAAKQHLLPMFVARDLMVAPLSIRGKADMGSCAPVDGWPPS